MSPQPLKPPVTLTRPNYGSPESDSDECLTCGGSSGGPDELRCPDCTNGRRRHVPGERGNPSDW